MRNFRNAHPHVSFNLTTHQFTVNPRKAPCRDIFAIVISIISITINLKAYGSLDQNRRPTILRHRHAHAGSFDEGAKKRLRWKYNFEKEKSLTWRLQWGSNPSSFCLLSRACLTMTLSAFETSSSLLRASSRLVSASESQQQLLR